LARQISSGPVAMLRLGPIRDFLGLIVGYGPAGVSNLLDQSPSSVAPWDDAWIVGWRGA